MKRIPALLTVLALLFILAACGTTPAQEETAAQTTELTTEPADALGTTLLPYPVMPSFTEAVSTGSVPVMATPAVTASAAGQTTISAAANAATTTTKPVTTATTKPVTTKTTATTKPTTKPVTTVTTTTTTTTKPTTTTTAAPQTWIRTITAAQLRELNCSLLQNIEIHSYNSYGTYKPYLINGYRLKDVLQALGANMNAITSASTLLTTASDGNKITITGNLITANETYIAMEYAESHTPGAAKSSSKTPRLFPAANLVNPTDTRVPGSPPVAIGTYVDNSLCNGNVISFTLTY